MIRVGGVPCGGPGDTPFCGLVYPDGDEITKHMAARLDSEPFYQSDKLFAALKVTKRRRVAIDCGAWVGGWSRELSKHFERVLSIEANSDSARCVVKNTAHLTNVAVINAAVADKSGETFIAREVNGANVGSYVDADKGVSVPMVSIDDVVAGLPEIDAIDYIKVHVNGMEMKALRGAAETIKKHRPVLTVVLKPALEIFGDNAENARGFLKGLGYKPAGGERPYEIWVPR